VKYTNLRSFEKHLLSSSPDHFANPYLVTVQDSFQRKQICDRLVQCLSVGQDPLNLNGQIFDAATTTINALLEELSSFSFFTKKRVIVVQNLDKAPKVFLEKLTSYLDHPNLSITLILTGASLNASTKLYKQIEKLGVVLCLPEEKPWEKEKSAQNWLFDQASSSKKKLSPEACLFFVKQLGTNTAVLHNELEKLISYVGGAPEITVNDIIAICSTVNIASIWQLGEAIFRREAATAISISKSLLEDGSANLLSLLRQLRYQFQTAYQVCCILASGAPSSSITEQFPHLKGAILERHMQLALSYGLQNFRAGILKIDETELKAKDSGADPALLNELLIVRLVK
jgi:DNA polymerase III subunit delta